MHSSFFWFTTYRLISKIYCYVCYFVVYVVVIRPYCFICGVGIVLEDYPCLHNTISKVIILWWLGTLSIMIGCVNIVFWTAPRSFHIVIRRKLKPIINLLNFRLKSLRKYAMDLPFIRSFIKYNVDSRKWYCES